MVCVNKNLEAMLSEIGNPRRVISDAVIPFSYYSHNPQIFEEHVEFFWLWQYERQLSDALQKLHLPIELSFSEEIDTPVQSAIENAYVHAGRHVLRRDMKKPIKVEVYLGEKGIVFTVTDSGEGFDFDAIVEQKRRNLRYYRAGMGNGFKVFDVHFNNEGKVPYEVSGERNRVNIMYKFQPEQNPLIQP